MLVYSSGSTDHIVSWITLMISAERPVPSIQAATSTSSPSSSTTTISGMLASSPAGAWKVKGV